MDLDKWINDPPSESEDESVPNNTPFATINNDQGTFYGESYYSGSNLDSNSGTDYQKATSYVELSNEELEERRLARAQSNKLNPFILKDSTKPKALERVWRNFLIEN